ncbi:aldo/keto reductase [Halalkalibacter lacteus]|uniref:aldo/keto reductase n=1 Tax=Halalkalibacter lacteus TaxID=3090663 RepID=UPI002FC625CD
MRYKQVQRTDIQCSVLCLGGANIGSTLNQQESFRLMDLYADRGGTFIDTAQVYANWLPVESSISEKTIGQWMKSRNNRNHMIVTTKGAHPRLETMHIPRLSPIEIKLDIEESLRNLQVDTIDLYFLHRDDTRRSVGEIIEVLNEQIKVGNIRYFGCSNWSTARVVEAEEYAHKHGLQGFSGNQVMWSLAEANPEKLTDQTLVHMDHQMRQLHRENRLAAFSYSPQAQGLFTKWDTGLYSKEDERINPAYQMKKNWRRFERAHQLASDLSITMNQVVLSYLTSQPFPTFPVIGCRVTEQLEENLKAVDVHLTQEQLDFLEAGNQ